MTKPTVFISYSHKDEEWKDRLRPHLGVLEQIGHITIWDDRQIGAGAEWYDEIQQVMERAAVAVCLISADYLASDFVNKEEIPYLLERCASNGMTLIPVLLRPCHWKVCHWLTPIQMIPRDGQSVASDFGDNWDLPFARSLSASTRSSPTPLTNLPPHLLPAGRPRRRWTSTACR